MTLPQIIQWSIVILAGIGGSVFGYYSLELFTKSRITWALVCAFGWIGLCSLMLYSSLFPTVPNKYIRVIKWLIFADGIDRGDLLQMAAYIVIIWCIGAMLINILVRRIYGFSE
jgi:hypothetical protein